MNKNIKHYERILKKNIELRLGAVDEWLEPQIHDAAMCKQMLEHVHEEIMNGKLVEIRQGSKDQWVSELNPLMPTYKELQRTMIQHYEALGLNYKSTPSKIKEDARKGIDTEKDGLTRVLTEANQNINSEIPDID